MREQIKEPRVLRHQALGDRSIRNTAEARRGSINLAFFGKKNR